MTFSESTRERAREIIARYPAGRQRSALLPLLHLVQSEEGYISPAGIAFCADLLGVTQAEVPAVATFYTMYKRTADRRLVGQRLHQHHVRVAREARPPTRRWPSYLGVGHDEHHCRTARSRLEHAECLAACDYAPVMTVNYEYFDEVTPDIAVEVVKRLQADDLQAPTRERPLSRSEEMSVLLAGFAGDCGRGRPAS